MIPKTLAEYSTRALLAELQRRTLDKQPSRISQCDECVHWRNATPSSPPDYNCCTKGHTMLFRAPTSPDPHDSTWGFYKPGCKDRIPVDAQDSKESDN